MYFLSMLFKLCFLFFKYFILVFIFDIFICSNFALYFLHSFSKLFKKFYSQADQWNRQVQNIFFQMFHSIHDFYIDRLKKRVIFFLCFFKLLI